MRSSGRPRGRTKREREYGLDGRRRRADVDAVSRRAPGRPFRGNVRRGRRTANGNRRRLPVETGRMTLDSTFRRLAFAPLPAPPGFFAIPLRLIVGYGFLAHGYAKLARGPDDFIAILHAIGMPFAFFLGWATIIIEVVGGLLILAGAFVPLASVPMIVVLLVAGRPIFTVHLPTGSLDQADLYTSGRISARLRDRLSTRGALWAALAGWICRRARMVDRAPHETAVRG